MVGFRRTLISNGIPVEFSIVPGSQADVKVLDQIPFCLPAGSALYADSAYTNYLLEYMLADEQIKLYSQRKMNAHRKDTPSLAYLKERMRKVIEEAMEKLIGEDLSIKKNYQLATLVISKGNRVDSRSYHAGLYQQLHKL